MLVAPFNFNLTRGDGRTIREFLDTLDEKVLQQGLEVQLDFRRTVRFMVPGALLLYAELHRVISLSTLAKPVKISAPKSDRARQVMKQIGIFELTGDVVAVKVNRADVIYWRLAKGQSQSGDEMQILEMVADRVNQSDTARIEKSGLWRGVTEAVNNAHEHAYKTTRADGFAGLQNVRWWLLTQIREQRFTAAVCDLGCGYEKTLDITTREWFQSIPRRISGLTNSDTEAIQAALAYGRSGTRLTERGKGSRDALALLEKHGNGELYLLSNRGVVRYVCKRGRLELKSVSPLDFDVKGTIIWWNLDLGAIQ